MVSERNARNLREDLRRFFSTEYDGQLSRDINTFKNNFVDEMRKYQHAAVEERTKVPLVKLLRVMSGCSLTEAIHLIRDIENMPEYEWLTYLGISSIADIDAPKYESIYKVMRNLPLDEMDKFIYEIEKLQGLHEAEGELGSIIRIISLMRTWDTFGIKEAKDFIDVIRQYSEEELRKKLNLPTREDQKKEREEADAKAEQEKKHVIFTLSGVEENFDINSLLL